MSSPNFEQLNLDNLVRNPDDGAYHCPQCQAPFTRRFNLRRHYAIHTRSMPFKCTVCGQEFSHSDEFHIHILTCAEETRNGPPEYLSQAITRLQSHLGFSTTSSDDLTPSLPLEGTLTPSISQVLKETPLSEIDQTFPQLMHFWTSSTNPPLTPLPYHDSELRGPFSRWYHQMSHQRQTGYIPNLKYVRVYGETPNLMMEIDEGQKTAPFTPDVRWMIC